MVLNVSNDESSVVGELTSNDSFMNSVTSTAPNTVIRRLKKKKHVTEDPDLKT
jgi:small nuclear ribonucleoprotein (snRNP)-like protein